jgi:PIN domain
LCDTLLRLAEAGAYRPLWSAGVLDELERNLLERGLPEGSGHLPDQGDPPFLPRRRGAGYEMLTENMACDQKDRHVLAAAVRGDAEVLVTFNPGDFPDTATSVHDITVVHPDGFLLDRSACIPVLP